MRRQILSKAAPTERMRCNARKAVLLTILVYSPLLIESSHVGCSTRCIAENCNCMTNVKCHEKFTKCIKKVQKSGKVGFSRDCPYDTAVPTMVQGMEMAIMFSQLGNSKIEL
ncbi:unnamed protein product [Cuscuta europaea]|uniref:Uncharacterized protein n=1 Tax=Cuscuta europaea TaxID=41803 RepID=A0A9P0ZCQ7_CUSEU|nr:unnamed protein product [Cuscuta europaea]